jgi:Zn-dependent metalloprotease
MMMKGDKMMSLLSFLALFCVAEAASGSIRSSGIHEPENNNSKDFEPRIRFLAGSGNAYGQLKKQVVAGVDDSQKINVNDSNAVKEKAKNTAKKVAAEAGYSTSEFKPNGEPKRNVNGKITVRLKSVIAGYDVERSGVVVVINDDGTAAGVSGDFISGTVPNLSTVVELAPLVAMDLCLKKSGFDTIVGQWDGPATRTVVQSDQGLPW